MDSSNNNSLHDKSDSKIVSKSQPKNNQKNNNNQNPEQNNLNFIFKRLHLPFSEFS